VSEIQPLKNVQQGEWLLHLTAFYETLLHKQQWWTLSDKNRTKCLFIWCAVWI